MTTNLIQNYIASKPLGGYKAQQQNTQTTIVNSPKKPMPNFDIQHELDIAFIG